MRTPIGTRLQFLYKIPFIRLQLKHGYCANFSVHVQQITDGVTRSRHSSVFSLSQQRCYIPSRHNGLYSGDMVRISAGSSATLKYSAVLLRPPMKMLGGAVHPSGRGRVLPNPVPFFHPFYRLTLLSVCYWQKGKINRLQGSSVWLHKYIQQK